MGEAAALLLLYCCQLYCCFTTALLLLYYYIHTYIYTPGWARLRSWRFFFFFPHWLRLEFARQQAPTLGVLLQRPSTPSRACRSSEKSQSALRQRDLWWRCGLQVLPGLSADSKAGQQVVKHVSTPLCHTLTCFTTYASFHS
jgi:hypothetical protein